MAAQAAVSSWDERMTQEAKNFPVGVDVPENEIKVEKNVKKLIINRIHKIEWHQMKPYKNARNMKMHL